MPPPCACWEWSCQRVLHGRDLGGAALARTPPAGLCSHACWRRGPRPQLPQLQILPPMVALDPLLARPHGPTVLPPRLPALHAPPACAAQRAALPSGRAHPAGQGVLRRWSGGGVGLSWCKSEAARCACTVVSSEVFRLAASPRSTRGSRRVGRRLQPARWWLRCQALRAEGRWFCLRTDAVPIGPPPGRWRDNWGNLAALKRAQALHNGSTSRGQHQRSEETAPTAPQPADEVRSVLPYTPNPQGKAR